MGILHVAREAAIHALGGYTKKEVITSVRSAIEILREVGLIKGREPCVREVEVYHRGGAIPLPASSLQVADEARPKCLLAEIAGSTVGTQLDIQRECIEGLDKEQELQGEKQVLDVVPSYCA